MRPRAGGRRAPSWPRSGFVALALHGYAQNTFDIGTNAYGSIYYTMTGFHLLHVIAGIGILTALLVGMRSRALHRESTRRR